MVTASAAAKKATLQFDHHRRRVGGDDLGLVRIVPAHQQRQPGAAFHLDRPVAALPPGATAWLSRISPLTISSTRVIGTVTLATSPGHPPCRPRGQACGCPGGLPLRRIPAAAHRSRRFRPGGRHHPGLIVERHAGLEVGIGAHGAHGGRGRHLVGAAHRRRPGSRSSGSDTSRRASRDRCPRKVCPRTSSPRRRVAAHDAGGVFGAGLGKWGMHHHPALCLHCRAHSVSRISTGRPWRTSSGPPVVMGAIIGRRSPAARYGPGRAAGSRCPPAPGTRRRRPPRASPRWSCRRNRRRWSSTRPTGWPAG